MLLLISVAAAVAAGAATSQDDDTIIQLQLFRENPADDLLESIQPLTIMMGDQQLVTFRPVYYSVARSNGRFSKRIRAFNAGSRRIMPSAAAQTNEIMLDTKDKNDDFISGDVWIYVMKNCQCDVLLCFE